MSENFGLKIGLEGEKEFKKSLAEINNSFKVLGSEMKLVDSQFDKNDKSTEALTARSEVLNKEIDQQKQKIETLRSALANAAESFGENDRRTQSWQIQLNNAQAALNGMERELNSNNTALEKADKGFDEAGDEAKDFSNSVKKAADTSEDADGKLSKLGDTAKKIGAALGAAAAAVGTACVAAGKKLWDMANDVGSAGDQIDKTSQKIGISAESYQKWGYVFERCGADVNNLQTGMKKLSTVITDAAGCSDSAAEKLSAVGLSIEELNGKSQDEQLSMVITALQGMKAGAERTAAANDLLGKSAVDMAAVLNTSVEETERLKQEAEDYGMVMSNEAVAASAAFEDSLTRLSHTAGGLKNRMVGELLPGITQITDGLADLLAGSGRTEKRRYICYRHYPHADSAVCRTHNLDCGRSPRKRSGYHQGACGRTSVGYFGAYSDHCQNCDRDNLGSGGTAAANRVSRSGYSAVAHQGHCGHDSAACSADSRCCRGDSENACGQPPTHFGRSFAAYNRTGAGYFRFTADPH